MTLSHNACPSWLLLLALSDGWVIGMWATNLGMNILTACALAWVATRTRRIESLEAELKESAAGLIDSKLENVEHRLQAGLEVLNAIIGEIQRRLERGDGDFHELYEKREKLQLEMMERIGELRDFVQRSCVLKDDFAAFRREIHDQGRQLSEQMEQIQQQMTCGGQRS